jgi:hypothetical protein
MVREIKKGFWNSVAGSISQERNEKEGIKLTT